MRFAKGRIGFRARALPRRLALSFTLILLAVIGCSSETTPTDAPLVSIPKPDLERLDKDARALVEEQLRSFEQTLSESDDVAVQAEAYGDLGRQYFAFEFRDAALACFENAVRLAPAEFRWRYHLGALLQERGELDRAVEELQRAHELVPDDLPTRLHLGRVEFDRGRAAAARQIFEQILVEDPSVATAHYHIGLIALDENKSADAIASLSEALRFDPEASSVHHSLGTAYRRDGDFEKARHHLEQGGSKRPRFEDPWLDSLSDLVTGARVHLQQGGKARRDGNLELAALHYRKATELDPENAIASFNLGAILGMMEQHDEALQHLDRAIELDPRHRDAHFDRASALTRLGHHEEAAAALEKVLEIDPEDRLARYRLALVLNALGDQQRAETELASLVATNPADVEARSRLAKLLLETGHSSEAERHYSEVLRLDPGNQEAYLGRARTLLGEERYQDARLHLEAGLEMGSPELVQMLARLLATCPEDGVRDGEKSLQLAQVLFESARTLENGATMAMAMAELGRFDEAAEWQRSLVEQAEKSQLAAARLSALKSHLGLYENGNPLRESYRPR